MLLWALCQANMTIKFIWSRAVSDLSAVERRWWEQAAAPVCPCWIIPPCQNSRTLPAEAPGAQETAQAAFQRAEFGSGFGLMDTHLTQHSCLSDLHSGTEDGLNSVSPLRRGPQLWCPLAGHQPSSPEGRKKQTGYAAPFSFCWGWIRPCFWHRHCIFSMAPGLCLDSP